MLSRQASEVSGTQPTLRLVSDSDSSCSANHGAPHPDEQGYKSDDCVFSEDEGIDASSRGGALSNSNGLHAKNYVATPLKISNASPSPASQRTPATPTPIVSSPSGQLLDLQNYLARPDRPLTIKERQARINAEIERQVSPTVLVKKGGRGKKSRNWIEWARCW